jgi:DNA repair protein RadC
MQNDFLHGLVGETQKIEYREFKNLDFHSLPPSQRPRERLVQWGAKALSDQELLAIILNSGIKGKNVGVLAAELLERLEQIKTIPTVRELSNLSGLGVSKSCAVIAMLELGRRYWDVSGHKIKTPQDIFILVRHYANRKQERFLSVSLNGAHEVIAVRVVTVGLVNRTIIHPREVFADPLSDRCSAICVCHNHPSGDLEPSREDDDVTKSLATAAAILGIRFLDHLIFSETSFFSYRREKRLSQIEKSNCSCADFTEAE